MKLFFILILLLPNYAMGVNSDLKHTGIACVKRNETISLATNGEFLDITDLIPAFHAKTLTLTEFTNATTCIKKGFSLYQFHYDIAQAQESCPNKGFVRQFFSIFPDINPTPICIDSKYVGLKKGSCLGNNARFLCVELLWSGNKLQTNQNPGSAPPFKAHSTIKVQGQIGTSPTNIPKPKNAQDVEKFKASYNALDFYVRSHGESNGLFPGKSFEQMLAKVQKITQDINQGHPTKLLTPLPVFAAIIYTSGRKAYDNLNGMLRGVPLYMHWKSSGDLWEIEKNLDEFLIVMRGNKLPSFIERFFPTGKVVIRYMTVQKTGPTGYLWHELHNIDGTYTDPGYLSTAAADFEHGVAKANENIVKHFGYAMKANVQLVIKPFPFFDSAKISRAVPLWSGPDGVTIYEKEKEVLWPKNSRFKVTAFYPAKTSNPQRPNECSPDFECILLVEVDS